MYVFLDEGTAGALMTEMISSRAEVYQSKVVAKFYESAFECVGR